jgi:hypothetical protein
MGPPPLRTPPHLLHLAVVARSSLAPFDCTHVGTAYVMDADPSIPCSPSGGPNARMRSVAAVSIVGFVLGLPAAFAAFLWRNWVAVRADQTLRERGEGETALTNPHFQVSELQTWCREARESGPPKSQVWECLAQSINQKCRTSSGLVAVRRSPCGFVLFKALFCE